MAQDALKAKMAALGMRPVATPDGELQGTAPFKTLVNAFTRSAILAATVKTWQSDSVRCIAPAHLTHLPSIRILDLATGDDFEQAVVNAYAWRLQKLKEANEFLAQMKLRAELDEPGFRVVSSVKVNGEDVRFTLRQGGIAQILTIAGKPMDEVDPRQRRILVQKSKSSADVVKTLGILVARLRAPKFEVEAEPTEEVVIRPRLSSAPKPPPAPSARAKNELFDHAFSGDLATDDPPDPTLGSQSLGAVTDDGSVPEKSEGGAHVAIVCAACSRFYLISPRPPDQRLLEFCPKCCGIEV